MGYIWNSELVYFLCFEIRFLHCCEIDQDLNMSPTNGEGKENSPASQIKIGQNIENNQFEKENSSNIILEDAAQNFIKSRVTYEEEEDCDSDEENQEAEDEKENARNRLKALLGGSSDIKKKSKPSQSTPSLIESSSQNQDEDEYGSDFFDTIEKMRNNLFDKLELWEPEDEDDEDSVDVSKLFYEGREGQKYTVEVLDKFFSSLKTQAVNFAQQLRFEGEQSQHKSEKMEKVLKKSKIISKRLI